MHCKKRWPHRIGNIGCYRYSAAWSEVFIDSGGKAYSLTEFSDTDTDIYEAFAQNMASDTNADIGAISYSTDIVSDIRRRLNALINVMLREINYLHGSGMTMKDPPTQGADFSWRLIRQGRWKWVISC